MAQVIRQEINLLGGNENVLSNSSGTVLGTTSTAIGTMVQMDTTKYSNATYYFEAVIDSQASNTGTFGLYDVAAAVDKATVTTTNTTQTLLRSTAFTPTAGAREYSVRAVGDGTRTIRVYSAKIIILQNTSSTLSATETQIEIGSSSSSSSTSTIVADVSPTTGTKLWKYNSANWDGSPTFSVEVCLLTAGTNTCTVTLCRTSDNVANVTVASAQTSSAIWKRVRVSFTPVNGETYKLRALGSTTKSAFRIAEAKIIVTQTNPTKIETQMLLLGQLTSNPTVVTGGLVQWNAAEWDAGNGTIGYNHLMDATSSQTARIYDFTASAAITNSASTGGPGQITNSGTMAAFTNGNLLCFDGTGLTASVAATRILVTYAYGAPPAAIIPDVIQQPLLGPEKLIWR